MKYKLSWMAIIAILFGTITAFATESGKYKNDKKLDSFYWFTPGTSPVYQDLKTVPDEQTRTSCTGSSALCENGYTSSQLKDPNNPALGVKAGQMPATQIFHI